jgi:hypothetical protein
LVTLMNYVNILAKKLNAVKIIHHKNLETDDSLNFMLQM